MLVGAFFAVHRLDLDGLGTGWASPAASPRRLSSRWPSPCWSSRFRANEVVVGLALNILAGGMTISLMKAIFGTRGSIVGHGIVGLPKVQIPGAKALLGSWAPLISGYTPIVYVAFIAVPLLVLFYNRTRLGLYIRVVGEKPEAAEALGISITRIRYIASLLCGLLAGLAGAHLSLGYITMFTENMSSGRGFMAVAILIFSNGDPLKVLVGCLLFGFADAFSLRLQTFGFPSYLVLAVPYLVALTALFALSYRARPKIIRETLADDAEAAVGATRTRANGRQDHPHAERHSTNGTHHSRRGFGRRRHPRRAVCRGEPRTSSSKAVTTVTGAAGPIEQVTNVVLNTLTLAGRDDIPVHAGAWRPIVGNSKADMEAPVHFEKRLIARFGDRLKKFNPPAPTPKRQATPGHAVDFIIDTVMANPGEITLVTTGPLTNAAMALLQEPRLTRALKRLLVLGGNFHDARQHDAADRSTTSGPTRRPRASCSMPTCDKILVPLDICEDNRVATSMLTRDDIADMQAAARNNPVVDMIADSLPDLYRHLARVLRPRRLPDGRRDHRGAGLRSPTSCTMTEPLFVDVVLDGRVARGQTVAYRGRQILPGGGPKTTRICTDLDGRRFLDIFKKPSLATSGRRERTDDMTIATPILFDCDPGHDDAIALVMAHRSPAIELLGVTTTCGNAELEKTTANALRILEYIGAGDVPVAQGCHRPLARPLVLGTADGPSGLEGSPYLPQATIKPVDQHAVDFLAEQAAARARADPGRRDRTAVQYRPADPQAPRTCCPRSRK